ncbi:LOW QUALITY PROTEIN: chloride channel protein C-like [Chlamydotis macqueenii]
MSSLFSHPRVDNDEEEMLMAEDHGPDLINPQDFRRQCSSSSRSLAYYHRKEGEREHLIAHESLDYLSSLNEVYKKWLQEKTYRKEWDQWLLVGLIGTAVGMLGFLIHQIIDSLIKLKWDLVENYLQDGNIHMTWLCALGSGLAMVVLCSGSVLFFCPAGSPSGLPEIIGYLNGTSIQHLFNIKTFLGTFVSCVLAVASGLFCGPEGPVVHLGALLGCGLSQLQSDTLDFDLPIFRFRNSADKCSFITAGAGAGVASVFRAPIGGLLFTLEEVSSFWDIRVAWQTFCCLMATFTTDLLSSSFYGFVYRGHFGFFEAEKRIVQNLLDINILAFIPTSLLGTLGGLLGALFFSLNIKINKLCMQFFNSIPRLSLRKTSKLLETVLILVCTMTITVYLPYFFHCTPVMSVRNYQLRNISEIINQFKREISEYSCSPSTWIGPDGVGYSAQTFNQAAALLVENGKQGITYLLKRGTHEEFGYTSLCTALAFYFILSCWTAGSAVGSGLVIPMLYTGALYGRIIGLIFVSIFGVQTNKYGAWIDPGLAAIGAASFFSGVSRLTISLTVIMIKITNDVQSLLLIMLAVMVARMVGDFFNAFLYSSLLNLKCIPYLDVEPFLRHRRKWLNLELFSARDVMEPGIRVLHLKENIASLAQLLASTSHGGFPVVCRPKPDHAEVFQGTIKRLELCMLLENEHIFEPETSDESFSSSHPLSYEKITVEKLPNLSRLTMLLNRYATDPRYQQLFINLERLKPTLKTNISSMNNVFEPYINRSATSVQAHFSLQCTYVIFCTLGLRHLTVVVSQNVAGVITRKDLMPFPLEEKLRLQLAPESPDVDRTRGPNAVRARQEAPLPQPHPPTGQKGATCSRPPAAPAPVPRRLGPVPRRGPELPPSPAARGGAGRAPCLRTRRRRQRPLDAALPNGLAAAMAAAVAARRSPGCPLGPLRARPELLSLPLVASLALAVPPFRPGERCRGAALPRSVFPEGYEEVVRWMTHGLASRGAEFYSQPCRLLDKGSENRMRYIGITSNTDLSGPQEVHKS